MAGDNREFDEFELGLLNIYESFKRLASTEGKPGCWDFDHVQANVHLESATKGPPARVVYRLTVTPQMQNAMGNLHGGCAATIIDNLSSSILIAMSQPGVFQYGGVSRNLSLTYLRPLPLGTEVRVVCELVQMGKRLGLVKTELRRADDDSLCVVADHQKANTDPASTQKL